MLNIHSSFSNNVLVHCSLGEEVEYYTFMINKGQEMNCLIEHK